MTAPALRVVTEDGELLDGCPSCKAKDEELMGMRATVSSQAAMIGRLKGKLEAADPEAHPRHKEMANLIDRWRKATGHTKSRASKDRFDLIRARLNDGYEIEELELALDGLAAFPYVANAQRSRTGTPSQRYDQMKHALGSGETLERFANLGHKARKEAQ